MNDLRKNRIMRASLSFLSVILVMQLAGCSPEGVEGGGMEGTGTGPTTNIYQLRNLPGRISPDIPKTLLRGVELLPPQPENPGEIERKIKNSSRMDDIDSVNSDGWFAMRAHLSGVISTRLYTEINSTIIDIAFDDIRDLCVDTLIDCTIPGDQINVKVTQEMINRFIELGTEWIQSLPPELLAQFEFELAINLGTDLGTDLEFESVDAVAAVSAQLTSLLDSEVVLGETRYSQLDGAPYDHSVQTVLSNAKTMDGEFVLILWQNQEFSARWNKNGNVAKFVIDDVGFPTREYFYQNNAPGELVITSFLYTDVNESRPPELLAKIIANDPNNAGVLVELAGVEPYYTVLNDELTVNSELGLSRGQIDDDGGYATLDVILFDNADTPKPVGYTGRRESFDGVGNLIAGTLCEVRDFDQGIDICEEDEFASIGPVGNSITDSPYFFQREDFNSLTAVEDAIQWTVEGLPAEIRGVAVVSADSLVELAERELLCRGFRLISNDTRMFCSATDEQLTNTIVLELVDGKPGPIIPTAKLVQIQ